MGTVGLVGLREKAGAERVWSRALLTWNDESGVRILAKKNSTSILSSFLHTTLLAQMVTVRKSSARSKGTVSNTC